MAIDFPSSPTVGQQYTYGGVTYTYTAQGVWATTPAASGGSTPTVASAGTVRGLLGLTTATTVSGSYRAAVLLNSAGDSVRLANKTWSLDITVAGSIANGRDTSAALANGDVSIYAIWGTATPTNSVIASNAAPDVGPALPGGYTHWVYLTTLKLTGGAFAVCYLRGSWVQHQNQAQILTSGSSASWASVSTAAFVPVIALNVSIQANALASTSAAGSAGLSEYIGVVSGIALFYIRLDLSFGGMFTTGSNSGIVPNVSQTLWFTYIINYGGANFASSALNLFVNGYEVPNSS